MVQGTASNAGKSVLVTALCRIFKNDGFTVAPFKAQNMSLNSFVTPDGGEIGRAQAAQAEAAGIAPTVDMNPILLKPEANSRSQVVVRGKPQRVTGAADYYRLKSELWPVVTESLDRLRSEYDVVVIEGAGSPAEVNLAKDEIVNMRVARYAQAPVLLVGDIDRGGVFAALLGTLMLLNPADRALVKALVVNPYRGDIKLFEPGDKFLAENSGLPVAGVIPSFNDIAIAP
ncbi:MAG: cobyric acid synthase, partial [Chloroflexi bacterium]|nr:cobyric acid synthase [Chloroflexota bacterium]